jgi:type II secretory pathway component PulC
MALALGLTALACGGSAPPPAARTPAREREPAAAATEAPREAQPTSTIRRSSIRAVLAQGPGAFLQRVSLDDRAVFAAGKFHGFRVARLNDAEFFRGVDLEPGDVITHINGFPIEHPEEALQAFTSLEVASELRVEYERDGVPRELRYPIVDDMPASPPAPARAPLSGPASARAPGAPPATPGN